MNFSERLFERKKSAGQIFFRHPLIISFALCLLLCSLSFMEQYEINGQGVLSVAFCLIALSFGACVYLSHKHGFKSWLFVVIFASFAALSYYICAKIGSAPRKTATMLVFCALILLAITVYLLLTKQMTEEKAVAVIFLFTVFIRFTYISVTSISTRAHDVISYAGTGNPYAEGHMGYILYLFNNGYALPFVLKDGHIFDQFYHPPLHHFLAAVWLKILSAFKVEGELAYSSLQTLTLFYSLVSTVFAYKILKLFKMNAKIRVLLFAVVAVHPSFTYMAADINNDMLSVALSFAALYYALTWNETRSLKEIAITAILIGFAMAAKLSAYLVCVPIGIIFAVAFFTEIKKKGNVKGYIAQFVIFLLICAPIGLYNPVRNAVEYGLPLNYVQKLPETSWQYVGNVDTAKRLFDFSSLFTSIYDQWIGRGAATYHEYNPLVALIKTSVFEEYINNSGAFSKIDFWAHVLYVCNIALIVFSVAAAIYLIVTAIKNKKLDVDIVALGAGYFAMIVSYYIFCFEYPHHCTENMRYVTPLILYGLIFSGVAEKRYETSCVDNKTAASVYKYLRFFLITAGILFVLATFGLVLKIARA